MTLRLELPGTVLVCVATWLAIAAAALPAPVHAQGTSADSGGSTSFLTPFPQSDTYKAIVIGDWMADGLLGGLVEAMADEPRVRLDRRARMLQSFLRTDQDQELRAFEGAIEGQGYNIAIVMTGVGDRVSIRAANGRRYNVDSDEWRQEFGRRIDAYMKAMRRRNISVYWVGLPIVRRGDWNADIDVINEVLRERSTANGIRYIDIYAETGDETGEYSPYGPDINGKNRLLRESDGVHFTPAGSRKLAFYVERELKRDMAQARVERTVPLAGSEAEQRRINPVALRPGAAAPSATGKAAAKDAKAAPSQGRAAQPDPNGEQRSDNSRVTVRTVGAGGREEQVTLDILRPAIPASVIQLVTRRDTGNAPSAVGDTLTDTLTNGTMVMRSITPTGDGAANRASRPPPTQLPFFRVMVKGERPTPRQGRADDHRWPRQDDIPPPEPAARPEAAPVPARVAPKGAPRVR
jgi:hypothetical protein